MIAHQRNQVLVINPNTSKTITDSFKPILSELNLRSMDITYWTCPTGPSIIKSQADMYESASHCIPLLLDIADEFDAFIGACYADHPVVRLLQSYVRNKPVVGIYEASIDAALQLVGPESKFGIVTTGLPYEVLLAEGVKHFLRSTRDGPNQVLQHFGGVVASGIGVGDLGPESRTRAREKIMAATASLVASGQVDVLCVGGVILAGMEPWMREACNLTLGTERGGQVKIIDQLIAGAVAVDAILRQDSVVDFSLALR